MTLCGYSISQLAGFGEPQLSRGLMFKKTLLLLAVSTAIAACQSSSTNKQVADVAQPSRAHSEIVNGSEISGLPDSVVEGAGVEEVATISDSTQQSVNSGSAGIDPIVVASTKSSSSKSGIVIPSYRPPKVGTVFYWKNNWNSLPKKLVHKVSSVNSTFQNTKAIEMVAVDGSGNGTRTYYDVKNSNLLGHKDKNGKPVVVFPKVEERLRFPMKPGDSWSTSWKSIDRSTEKTTTGGGVVKVVGVEALPVAGKKLKTMKLRLPLPRSLGSSMKHYIWYSPKFGIIVREQISNNSFSWVKELEKVQLPG